MTFTKEDVERQLDKLEFEVPTEYNDIKRIIIASDLTEEIAWSDNTEEYNNFLFEVRKLNDWRAKLEEMAKIN